MEMPGKETAFSAISGLPRRPTHRSPAQQVNVQMIHRLPSVGANIDDRPEPLHQSIALCDPGCHQVEMSKQCLILLTGMCQRRNVFPRHYQHVTRRLRVDVPEGKSQLIFEDFSEDTYRTLTAVDSAVMVIDAAKGIEARTRKLFEVCRLRDIPIVTFINKLDRESRDPFEILDEIEKTLALDTAPLTWPIGSGRDFKGTYDLRTNQIRRFGTDDPPVSVNGPQDSRFAAIAGEALAQSAADEIDLVRDGCNLFDLQAFREGHLTPVFFGSALRTFGVADLIAGLAEFAPSPRPIPAASRIVDPRESKMTGFVFKIQANMDPNHRDRIAFFRVTSGRLQRGMKAKLLRTGKSMAINAPQFFFAQERTIADEAMAGDVVGIPNHGTLRIGDTLSEGEDLVFRGVPSFAPEILRRVRIGDAMRAKKLREALQQMGEEGVMQVFVPEDGGGVLVGVVGALQLDVLAERLKAEYGLEVGFETSRFETCRWVTAPDRAELDRFLRAFPASVSRDLDGAPVFMATSAFTLRYEQERWPDIVFSDVKDYQAAQ